MKMKMKVKKIQNKNENNNDNSLFFQRRIIKKSINRIHNSKSILLKSFFKDLLYFFSLIQ